MMYALAQTFHENLLQFYLEKLATPEGIALVSLGLIAAALMLAVDRFRWVGLTLTILFGSMSYLRAVQTQYGPPVAPEPFRTISSLSQPLTFGAILLLAIAALKPIPWRRARLIHPALLWLLLLQFLLSSRQFLGGFMERGATGYIVYALLFLVLGIGVSRWLHDESQVRSLARAISWLAILICVSTMYVLIVNRDAAFFGERLTGPLDNPQRLASLLALSIPFSLLLATDPGNVARSRTFHMVVAGVSTVFLMWTASRAGGLALLVGGAVFFRRRLGWGLLSLILGAGIVLVLLSMTESDISSSASLMFRTNNSRYEVWSAAMQYFYQSPMIGTSMDMAAVESSYISVAAATGLMGLVPLALMLAALGMSCWKVARHRHLLGPYKPAVDLFLAVSAQFVVLWTFDGYIVGLVTNAMLLLYCILGVGTLLMERIDDVASGASLPLQHGDEAGGFPVVYDDSIDPAFAHAR